MSIPSGFDFAECIIYSFNYGQIDALNKTNDLPGVLRLLIAASRKVVTAGAECVVLCANTLHYFASDLVPGPPRILLWGNDCLVGGCEASGNIAIL